MPDWRCFEPWKVCRITGISFGFKCFLGTKSGWKTLVWWGWFCKIIPVFVSIPARFRVPLARIAGGMGEDILKNRHLHSAHEVPVKKRRLRRSFQPPCGQAVFVTENISRNGKHSLLSPETYNVPGTQKRVEYHVLFPLVRRPAQRGEPPVPEADIGNKTGQNGRARKTRPSKKWLTDWRQYWLTSVLTEWLTSVLTDVRKSRRHDVEKSWRPEFMTFWFPVVRFCCCVVV